MSSVADRVDEFAKKLAAGEDPRRLLTTQLLIDLAVLVQHSREREELQMRKFREIDSVMRQAHALVSATPIGETISFELRELGAPKAYGFSYGQITSEMVEIIKKHIKGRKVFDIMGGDGFISQQLLDFGAREVVLIERDMSTDRLKDLKTLNSIRIYNQALEKLKLKDMDRDVDGKRGDDDVAFLSWPPNREMFRLLELLKPFKKVIYLGKNYDLSACAWPGFFREMRFRSVLGYVKDIKNSLIIYGATRVDLHTREMVGEEVAGIDHSRVYSFTEI